ncbi:hypothetical protein V413_18995 [Escherichia coli LAU-EC8]|nr:hypothetical protein PPECC33_04768 [Escherichia coli PCN033]ETE07419.1 hypothetical protein V413_18995 [Escherichia coli LAU-EC8]ETE35824.1 hypothetical protein V414_18765 [Escherichia coli LAU-EC9]
MVFPVISGIYSVHANNLMKQGNAIKPDKDNMD